MSDIKDWSNTANNNNSTPPDGFPEGMNPSDVNNAAREVMAAVRRQHEDSAWIDLGDTPSYVSATSFTISGDVTTAYAAGRRIRATDSSTLYGVISSSSYGAPNTTVNVTLDSGSLSGSLSAVALSVLDNNSKGGTIAGDLTVSGSFTSPGIDDNATGEVFQLTDSAVSSTVDVYASAGNPFEGGADGWRLGVGGVTYATNTGGDVLRVYENGNATENLSITSAGALTCKAFTSTGIDDNANATAITIDTNENTTFSGTVFVENDAGTEGRIALVDSGATADEGRVDILTQNDQFSIRAYNDAFTDSNNIMTSSRTGALVNTIVFYTGNDVTALTIDSSQNATFAGDVTLSQTTSPVLTVTDTTNNVSGRVFSTDSRAGIGSSSNHSFVIQSNSADALTIDTSQNGTFANDVTVTGNISAANFNGLTLGTEQASTSGTAIDFTGLPAGLNRITVMLEDVSLDASGAIACRLGDSGGFETTGYAGDAIDDSGALVTTTDGQLMTGLMGSAAATYGGVLTITRMNGNKWHFAGSGVESGVSDDSWICTGTKTLSAELDRVRIYVTIGNFDAGNINILYE